MAISPGKDEEAGKADALKATLSGLARPSSSELCLGYIIATSQIKAICAPFWSSRGRAVKAMDSKSIGESPRRFESCRLRCCCLSAFFFDIMIVNKKVIW